MNIDPSLYSIYERLEQAQRETHVVLPNAGRPSIINMEETTTPGSCWEGRREMNRLMDAETWQATGTGFQELREWVEGHWMTDEEKFAPDGTVPTREDWVVQSEKQLDSVTATRKLIAAAKIYGRELVGKYAADFAVHGMIEVQSIFLLKGPPIAMIKPLDDYCALLPYGEVQLRVSADSDPTDFATVWPECDSENVCGLQVWYFERASVGYEGFRRYSSPLLKEGPEHLALLLGLVWGTGFRVFGSWQNVSPVAMAALPYKYATWRSSASSRSVALALPRYGPPLQRRPLAIRELRDLAEKYSELPETVRNRLARAMQRIRNSAERADDDDKVIDLGVAMSILFTGDGEQDDPSTLVPGRAAWHYADSQRERRQTERMLDRFYAHYSKVVRGQAIDETDVEGLGWNQELLADTDNVVRACLEFMIAGGLPEDWNEAVNSPTPRFDPPRAESEIPSVKSDYMSWTIEEQREIDRELGAVWRSVVEEAPDPPSHVGPLIVTGVLEKIVKEYDEQRIPYVVLHPARLYMAHPKWPHTESEPLDDRVRYYCERDVEKHLGLWMDAAKSKGLVLLTVTNDAELYRPERRDQWPEPLLSSHEEDATTRTPSRGTPLELTASSAESNSAQHNAPDLHSEEGNPTDPPSKLPDSVQFELEKEWVRLWKAFQHDVNVETDSLLHLLEAIHAKHLTERQRLAQAIAASGPTTQTLEDAISTSGNTRVGPMYPEMRGVPVLTGEPLYWRSAPEGPMEQNAFKAWVSNVWYLWESRYRNQLRHSMDPLPGVIRPLQQVLGDLRHIRNDLLHNGIAKRDDVGRCEILQWFTVGELMHMRLRHVIDFLNQMGWLHQESFTFVAEQGKGSIWVIQKEGELEEPTPALISARPFVDPQEIDPPYRYAVSVAFENFVFGTIPMGPESEETQAQAKDRAEKWMKMTVNERGDLHVPDLGTASAAQLYWNCLKGGTQRRRGIWSPAVQFRQKPG